MSAATIATSAASQGSEAGAEAAEPGAAIFLLFEGGQFIWPGIELGYQRHVVIHDRAVVLETVALQPLILSIDGLLSDDETSLVISSSEKHMAPSQVTMADHDKGKADLEFRTSTTYWLHSRTSWLQNIDLRVSNLTRTSINAQESVQVLRYEPSQYYGAHLDYTDRKFYAKDRAHMERQQGTYKNRMATVFWYLSDVAGGPLNRSGVTNFPRAGGLPHPRSTRSCDSGAFQHCFGCRHLRTWRRAPIACDELGE